MLWSKVWVITCLIISTILFIYYLDSIVDWFRKKTLPKGGEVIKVVEQSKEIQLLSVEQMWEQQRKYFNK